MPSKKQKLATRRHKAQHDALEEQVVLEEQYRPKAGPGQVFKRELIDLASGQEKRYRNIAATPMLLAYEHGKFASPDANDPITADDRWIAAEKFERLFYQRSSSAKDSLDRGIGGGTGLFWTEVRQNASDALANIRQRMHYKDFIIVERFCGMGYTMVESLRGVVQVHRDGTAFRIREALDDLVAVTTGQRYQFEHAVIPLKANGVDSSHVVIHPFQKSA